MSVGREALSTSVKKTAERVEISEMSIGKFQNRDQSTRCWEPGEPWPSSLLVHLHRISEGRTCVAEFCGVLTGATLATIDAIFDLIEREDSVVLDFTRVEVVDGRGAEAVAALSHSLRSHGSHLVLKAPVWQRKNLPDALSSSSSDDMFRWQRR
jgi:hypothetical protein